MPKMEIRIFQYIVWGSSFSLEWVKREKYLLWYLSYLKLWILCDVSGWPSGLPARCWIMRPRVRIPLEAEFSLSLYSNHCTEPFIITLLSLRYDLNNVERGVKHQLIIIYGPCDQYESTRENLSNAMCTYQRIRSDCTSLGLISVFDGLSIDN